MRNGLVRILALWVAIVTVCAAMEGDVRAASNKPRQDLPFAGDRAFANLDAYLAFRKEQGAMDKPYYERLPDGRYELMTGRAQQGRQGRIFTREQLMMKYGFDR